MGLESSRTAGTSGPVMEKSAVLDLFNSMSKMKLVFPFD